MESVVEQVMKKGVLMLILLMWSSLTIGQNKTDHKEEGHAHLMFQCAVCSNHLGHIEASEDAKRGFILNAHKNSLVEVEGLYKCEACKTPIFRAKNLLDLPQQDSIIFFDRPIDNQRLALAPYNSTQLGELKDHCPACANKFANSRSEVVMGNFGANITFKDLKGIFRKR